MKYIDADRLRSETENLRRIQRAIGDSAINSSMRRFYEGTEDMCNRFLSLITSLQQEQPEVELENYISNKLRELGADLINHKPYSFNRGLNVGETNAYHDILDRLNARKEE